MATEQCTVLIDRPADDILEFILDVRAYRDVDPRLGSIRWVRRMPGSTVFRFRPQLMGLPAPLSTQLVVRRGMKVDITALPSPSDRLADFAGSLACVAGPQGITVTRSLRFDLAAPLAPILDRRLQRWLQSDVPAEMARLKARLEEPPSPSPCAAPRVGLHRGADRIGRGPPARADSGDGDLPGADSRRCRAADAVLEPHRAAVSGTADRA